MALSKRFTLQLEAAEDIIDADAFVLALATALNGLKAVNKELSEFGSENVQWFVVDAGHSSPPFATFAGSSTSQYNGAMGSRSIDAFLDGIEHLENHDTCPPFYNDKALKCAARFADTFARGATGVKLQTDDRIVRATHRVAQHANNAIRRLEHEKLRAAGKYVDFGTIEGHLRDVQEQSRQDKTVIVDDITGDEIPCYTSDDLEQRVRDGWKHRVSVRGEVTYERPSGRPVKIVAESIRILGDSKSIPRISDLYGIDITGGIDPVDYVRAMRDGDITESCGR